MAASCSITYTCQVQWNSSQNLFFVMEPDIHSLKTMTDLMWGYLFILMQRLILKPRIMWLLLHRPRLDIRSSCPPLLNPQNISPTPAACSTLPPAARRPPHLKVSQTHIHKPTGKLSGAHPPEVDSRVSCSAAADFLTGLVHPYAISVDTNGFSVHLFCLCGVFMYVFSLWPVS